MAMFFILNAGLLLVLYLALAPIVVEILEEIETDSGK